MPQQRCNLDRRALRSGQASRFGDIGPISASLILEYALAMFLRLAAWNWIQFRQTGSRVLIDDTVYAKGGGLPWLGAVRSKPEYFS